MNIERIAILGTGSMGSAILAGLLAAGFDPARVSVSTKSEASARKLNDQYAVAAHALETSAEANRLAVAGADVVLVGVKPAYVASTLAEVADALAPDALVISVAAGITNSTMEAAVNAGVRVIRSMPNTPAIVGRAVTGLAKGSRASEADLAVDLFLKRELAALLPSAVSSMGGARPALEPLSGAQRISLRPSRSLQRGVRSVLGLAVLMLLVTAAFLWLPSPETWWPGFSRNEPTAAAVEEVAVPLGQAVNPESTDDAASAASAATPGAAPVSGLASGPVAAASAPAPVQPVVPAVAASVASPKAAPVAVAPSPTVAPAILRLEASADTWVEVRDAKGPVLSKLLKSAETLEIQQPAPYSVVIGRAAAVKATLRGQPFDLKPHAPQSVARFEVKE